MAAFLIAGLVQRRQHLLGEFRGFVEHRIDDVARRRFVAGQALEQVFDIEHVVQRKTQIGERCGIAGHRNASQRQVPGRPGAGERRLDRSNLKSAFGSLVSIVPESL